STCISATSTFSLHDALPILVLSRSQVRKIDALNIPGIYALESDDRLDPERPARQLIGRIERNPFLVRKWYEEEWKRGEVDAYSQDRKSTRLNSSHVKISYAV